MRDLDGISRLLKIKVSHIFNQLSTIDKMAAT
jgi:hypothetical protein